MCPASCEDQPNHTKSSRPKSDSCRGAVLVDACKLQIAFRPALLHLECARFIARDLQISGGFGMMRFQRERTFVIQDRPAKIARAKVSVAKTVKQISAHWS